MFGKIIRGYLNLETCCSKNEIKSCHPLSPIYLLPVLIPIGFFTLYASDIVNLIIPTCANEVYEEVGRTDSLL